MASFLHDTGEGHLLHVETYGDPAGAPVLFLHGGPGSGCNAGQRALFDPNRQFAVFLDQRGAGKSQPARSREENTTPQLIGDLEAVRQRLGISRWVVAGGSWGATLGLAYAETHPEAVAGLALRAVFLGTRAELLGAFVTRLALFYPDLHAALLASDPQAADPLEALWRRILDPDPAIHRPAAFLYYDIERSLSELAPALSGLQPVTPERPLPATPFMEAHYFLNDCFLAPDQLLRDAARLKGIPGILVQSRYDLLCPPATTAALAAVWQDARIEMVEAAGHSMGDGAVRETLAKAIAELTGCSEAASL